MNGYPIFYMFIGNYLRTWHMAKHKLDNQILLRTLSKPHFIPRPFSALSFSLSPISTDSNVYTRCLMYQLHQFVEFCFYTRYLDVILSVALSYDIGNSPLEHETILVLRNDSGFHLIRNRVLVYFCVSFFVLSYVPT